MRKMKIAPVLLSGLLLIHSVPVYAADSAAEGYVYGTVNLSYADYYYGEVNEVAANATMDLTAADKTSESAGAMYGYDAVTSCTTAKSKRYTESYFEEIEGSSVKIYGMKDVAIAVPKSLYEDANAAIQSGAACSNDLLEIVKNMTVTGETPTAYKVLNGDGTLGKMTGVKTTVAEGASASITASSTWGQYQISVEYLGEDGKSLLPSGQSLVGAILETSDGAKYGLEHLDNLWFQAAEIAFAVTDGFTVPQGNTIQYKRFEDIVGKTITSITYLYKDQNIVIDHLNLPVKTLLSDDYKAQASNGVYNAEGKKTTIEVTVPSDSNYVLSDLLYENNSLIQNQDYTVVSQNDGSKQIYQISFQDTDHVKIGAYTVTFTDDKYEDISTTFELKADMAAEDVQFVDNKLVIHSDVVDVQTYINAISSISVNGSEIRGAKGSSLFDEEGNVLLDAEASFHGRTTVFFPEEGTYTIAIKATGYPDLTGTVTIGTDAVIEQNSESALEGADTDTQTSPQTGDTVPVVPITLAAVLSLIAIAVGKKRKEV